MSLTCASRDAEYHDGEEPSVSELANAVEEPQTPATDGQ